VLDDQLLELLDLVAFEIGVPGHDPILATICSRAPSKIRTRGAEGDDFAYRAYMSPHHGQPARSVAHASDRRETYQTPDWANRCCSWPRSNSVIRPVLGRFCAT
jgi:hypothetical protein